MATKKTQGQRWTILYTFRGDSRIYSLEVGAVTAEEALKTLGNTVGSTDDHLVFKGSFPGPVLSAH